MKEGQRMAIKLSELKTELSCPRRTCNKKEPEIKYVIDKYGDLSCKCACGFRWEETIEKEDADVG